MTTDRYILVNGEPVVCNDILVWGKWFQNSPDMRVKQEEIGQFKISTVFLGMDHNWGDGPPLLFETMIFGGGESDLNEWQDRCGTLDAAKAMHARAVALVNAEIAAINAKKKESA